MYSPRKRTAGTSKNWWFDSDDVPDFKEVMASGCSVLLVFGRGGEVPSLKTPGLLEGKVVGPKPQNQPFFQGFMLVLGMFWEYV